MFRTPKQSFRSVYAWDGIDRREHGEREEKNDLPRSHYPAYVPSGKIGNHRLHHIAALADTRDVSG